MFIKKSLVAALGLSALLLSTNANAEAYITAGAGYDLNKLRINLESVNSTYDTKKENFTSGGNADIMVGVGGCLNPDIRADVTLNYQPNTHLGFKVKTVSTNAYHDKFSFDSERLTALANLYWDIRIHEKFVPYVTMGLGATYSKVTNIASNYDISNLTGAGGNAGFTSSITTPNGKSLTKFDGVGMAYQVGLGMSTPFNDNVTLDMGYRFLGLGSTLEAKYNSGAASTNPDTGISTIPNVGTFDLHKFKHSLVASVRFNF